MNEELKAVIEKNLPAMAAGEMKKFIEQAEKDKAALKAAQEQLAHNSTTITFITKENGLLLAKSNEVLKVELEQAAQAKELDVKSRNLKIAELTYQLDAEKKSKLDIFNLVNTFVANSRAIEIMSRSQANQMGAEYYQNSTHHYVLGEDEKSISERIETKDKFPPSAVDRGLDPR